MASQNLGSEEGDSCEQMLSAMHHTLGRGHTGKYAPVAGTREASERDEIVRILKVTNGRVGGPDGAAARMGIKRTTLISSMKKLDIDRAKYREPVSGRAA